DHLFHQSSLRNHRIHIESQQTHHQHDALNSDESLYSLSSPETEEPIDTDLLSDLPRTIRTDKLIDNDDNENYIWLLDLQFSLAG
ncbi:unnamed protein product, partial [Rotaria sordida]